MNIKTQRTTNRAGGMTLIEVLVVVFTIALLAAIFLPVISRPKQKSSRIGCVNYLKQIDLSFRLWEEDNGGKYPMQFAVTNSDMMKLMGGGNAYVLWQSMSNQLSTPKILYCPADSEHIAAANFSNGFSDANISYFFSLDASENNPQALLAGDDNFAVNGKPVHPGILNIATNSPITWTAARHKFTGNIGLADGSVQAVTTAGFTLAISNAAAPVRLVIP
jgi:prepilin-type processing-associated H-X9-DG protein